MPTLLHIDASPRGDYSLSRQLTAEAVAAWQAAHPDGTVVRRDLTKTELSFIDIQWIMGAFTPPDQHTEEHKRALAISDTLISELLAADVVVIGTPMYNFGVPAVLKAWIDHIVRAGKTFGYAGLGHPIGLVTDRKFIVAIASAGSYVPGSTSEPVNQLTPYLRTIFGYIGVTDLTFVHAGGTAGVMKGEITSEAFLAPFVEEIRAAV